MATTKRFFILENGKNVWWVLGIFPSLKIKKMLNDCQVFFHPSKWEKCLAPTKHFSTLQNLKNPSAHQAFFYFST
jgi:hypothetical protein